MRGLIATIKLKDGDEIEITSRGAGRYIMFYPEYYDGDIDLTRDNLIELHKQLGAWLSIEGGTHANR